MNYYNENCTKSAAWIRELILAGEIPPGDVDERSICDVRHEDLRGYTQCHFFAGIAGWPLALRLAGWPEDRPVWTGSAPCQPFSVAGKQRGTEDERHLWPEFFRLIRECRPECIFGEQVPAAIRLGWLDGISADLEAENYAVGSIVLGAHSVGATHIRQRLYWVGHSTGYNERRDSVSGTYRQGQPIGGPGRTSDGGLVDAVEPRLEGHAGDGPVGIKPGRLNAVSTGPATKAGGSGHWSDYTVIHCLDGKSRRVKRGLQCLVNGIPDSVVPGSDPSEQEAQATAEARVMRLKGYGNAIVPQVAATFIKAYMELK